MAEDKKELADSASGLMVNKAFQHAVLTLRKQWFQEMLNMEPTVGSEYTLRCALACARMKALEAIPTELQVIVNQYKLDKKING